MRPCLESFHTNTTFFFILELRDEEASLGLSLNVEVFDVYLPVDVLCLSCLFYPLLFRAQTLIPSVTNPLL